MDKKQSQYQYLSPAAAYYMGARVEVIATWTERGIAYCRIQFADGGKLTVMQSQVYLA